jgi:hypothetical protein
MAMAALSDADEAALQAFLAPLPPDAGLAARTLAHAWAAAGGTLQVGKLTARLVAAAPDGRSFTAATLHGLGTAGDGTPRLEVARVLLQAHGVTATDWTSWCDERAELAAHGFDRAAKYPSLRLADLPPATVARLALGLRDLCRLAQGLAA